ncbi:MAG TPA: hypothetical protein VK753_03955, partial [Xanthomonadaceae bacterium]|nr:hypothetical protein [Xanthomonadaceae bacterium]
RLDQQTFDTVRAILLSRGTFAFVAYWLPVNLCNRNSKDFRGAARAHWLQDCAQAGRTMMAHSTSMDGRHTGVSLLRETGLATAEDIANARVVEWQYENYSKPVLHDPAEQVRFLKEEASTWVQAGDEVTTLQRMMQQSGVALTPPANWQPHDNDGKPVGALR